MNSPPPLPSRSRGSALITVIIFTAVMALLVGSIVGWSLTERNLNARTAYWLEARNAAQALAEYGASQICYSNTTFEPAPQMNPFGDMTSSNVPLQLPVIPPGTPNSNSFFNPTISNGLPGNDGLESHIDTGPLSSKHPYGLELIGGPGVKIPIPDPKNPGAPKLLYINPTIPENKGDPFAGLSVSCVNYQVLAKATAVPPGGLPPISAFVTETVSVRAVSLFNFAIFYGSNDLEIYPGADMVVTGPVHANGNMFLNATSGSNLTFDGTVSASGNIYHAMESGTAGQKAMTNDDIFFAKQIITPFSPANMFSMYDGTHWNDSTMGQSDGVFGTDTTTDKSGNTVPTLAYDAANPPNPPGQTFTDYAKTTWPGNVLTQVPTFNPVGFDKPLQAGTDPVVGSGKPYLPDSAYVDSGDQATVNNALTIDDHTYADPVSQQLVTQAGNVSYINDPPDADFDVNATTKDQYYLARAGLEGKKYANLANLYVLVVVTPGTAGAADQAQITYYGPYNQGTLKTLGYGPNGGVLMGTPANLPTIPSYKTLANVATITNVEPPRLVSFVPYVLSGSNVTQGLYDQREGKAVDLVQLDMQALNVALTQVNLALRTPRTQPGHPPLGNVAIINLNGPYTQAPVDNIWGSGQNAGTVAGTTAADDTAGELNNVATNGGWNGIIYVDIEWQGPPPANTEVALGIGNAETLTTTDANGVTTIGTNSSNNLANGETPTIPTINLIPNNTESRNNGIPPHNDSAVGIDRKSKIGDVSTPAIGVSIATNAPIYLEGNFNADGYIDPKTPPADPPAAPVTGGPQLPDDETSYANGKWSNQPNLANGTDEVPVAVVGDAVTILSPCYFGGTPTAKGKPPTEFVFPIGTAGAPMLNRNPSSAYFSELTPNPSVGGKITAELATAMIAGIRVTDSTGGPKGGGSASGGADNLPRFIENWAHHALCIRGSMVNLYSSKFGTGRFHGNDSNYTPPRYYNPPDRQWGWDHLFESGVYPPGTPVALSVRRLSFNDLSPEDYTKARNDSTWGWPGTFPSIAPGN